MELIAGSSLQDYLSLLKETNRKMIEEIFGEYLFNSYLALRYLHKEKGIVHRDLTANNIMLDDEYRVKISKYMIYVNFPCLIDFIHFLADFGLAKLRDNDCSKMTSVVGTLYYACPEIIQHTPYNEKAGLFIENEGSFDSLCSLCFRYLEFRLCSISYVNISSTILYIKYSFIS